MDVIFDYPKEGIVRFTVRDLPKEIPRDGRVNRVMIIFHHGQFTYRAQITIPTAKFVLSMAAPGSRVWGNSQKGVPHDNERPWVYFVASPCVTSAALRVCQVRVHRPHKDFLPPCRHGLVYLRSEPMARGGMPYQNSTTTKSVVVPSLSDRNISFKQSVLAVVVQFEISRFLSSRTGHAKQAKSS